MVRKTARRKRRLHIGFVSTRFKGLDGVSLEAGKWAQVFEKRFGYRCYWFAGELDCPADRCLRVPEAFFGHPDNEKLNALLFGKQIRSRETTNELHARKELLKNRLYEFVERFRIDLLVAENVLAIPMHVPLGLALTELIAETGLPTIGHHHDFYWERPRFMLNAVGDLLNQAFPPDLPSIRHVVINSVAQKELAARRGISAQVIFNVVDFENPPQADDPFNRTFRADFGFDEQDVLILQPTRVISRKGIEQALLLMEKLDIPRRKMILSHSASDEGLEYFQWLRETAAQRDLPVSFIHNMLHESRRQEEDGRKLYSLWDVYPNVDLVTYPSLYEGFGNAFLEAVYFRKPLLINRYSVYIVDIEPKGFDVVAIDGYLDRRAVREVEEVLKNPERRQRMVERNYELGRRYFSFSILRRGLSTVLSGLFGSTPGLGPDPGA